MLGKQQQLIYKQGDGELKKFKGPKISTNFSKHIILFRSCLDPCIVHKQLFDSLR